MSKTDVNRAFLLGYAYAMGIRYGKSRRMAMDGIIHVKSYMRKGNPVRAHTRYSPRSKTGEDEHRKRLIEWQSPENRKAVAGMRREQIYALYDNTPKPIAYFPEKHLKNFRGKAKDNQVYCGQAHFLHHLNEHPNITEKDFLEIQGIFDKPDEVIRDERTVNGVRRDNLIFTKKQKDGKHLILAVGLDENSRLILHRTFAFNNHKKPHSNLNRV